jgi:alkylated DNA repair dioxygenase AlkB
VKGEKKMMEPDIILEERFLRDSSTLFIVLSAEVAWETRIQARQTASFGQAYNYSGITYETVPMHPRLIPIVDALEARLCFRPNNCLLNYYPTGVATMGFHSDSTAELTVGTGIAIVSLGARRSITFQYKHGAKEEFEYPLMSGSLLYMSPELQQDWRHAIRKQPEAGGRISLTFRQIAL